jgi:hypothetical protein
MTTGCVIIRAITIRTTTTTIIRTTGVIDARQAPLRAPV